MGVREIRRAIRVPTSFNLRTSTAEFGPPSPLEFLSFFAATRDRIQIVAGSIATGIECDHKAYAIALMRLQGSADETVAAK